ncbi:hypothetical protein [Sodalis glossinidius]|uniref:hypothetical protein n=1 Tax=Sodalis glossinidius TaxID=63612 RepID=UPI0003095D33|nr:hypothetical protein [Sodalis glossinidius]
MQNLINVQDLAINSDNEIDSQRLLNMVNETRKEYGEPPIRIFVGQKNGADIEIIHMTLKQALRVAARESKAVRRSLIDKLEQQAAPKSQAELNLAYALAQVAQEHRLKSVETQVEQVAEEIDHIKQGIIPAGYQGYSFCKRLTASAMPKASSWSWRGASRIKRFPMSHRAVRSRKCPLFMKIISFLHCAT